MNNSTKSLFFFYKFSIFFIFVITFIMMNNSTTYALRYTRPTSKVSYQKDKGVPILLYHRIEKQEDINNYDVTIAVTPEEFKEQMKYLKDNNYNTITYDQLYNFMKNGSILPSKPIIISFDDGYYSTYEYAYPILKELGMKAEVAVVTGTKERDKDTVLLKKQKADHFNWKQAIEMEKSGFIDLQSHTVTHEVLDTVSNTSLTNQLKSSKDSLEKVLSKKISTIIYPQGGYNENVITESLNAGYKIGVTTKVGLNYYKDNVMTLKRFIVCHGNSAQQIEKMINEYSLSDKFSMAFRKVY